MKRFALISALFLSSLYLSAQTKADTISINQESIERWIIDNTKTNTGKPTTKYYCIYKGKLVPTNKTTYKNVELCKRYNIKPALVLITNRTGKKRIVSL